MGLLRYHQRIRLYGRSCITIIVFALVTVVFVTQGLHSTFSSALKRIDALANITKPDGFASSWDRKSHSNLVENAIPWMSIQVRSLIASYLDTNATMLEYGGGGSTLYFAPLVKQLYTVESVGEFVKRLNKTLALRGITNAKVAHKAPNGFYDSGLLKPSLEKHPLFREMQKADVVDDASLNWWSTNGGPQGIKLPPPPDKLKTNYHKFKGNWKHNSEYVRAPEDFGLSHYDIVLVDGVARGACAFFILDYITETSRVFIHDFFNAASSVDWENKFNLSGLGSYYTVVAKVEELSPYVSGGTVVVLQKKTKAELTLDTRRMSKYEKDRNRHRDVAQYQQCF